jgi:hypothetical protein
MGHNGMIVPGITTLMFFNPSTKIGGIYFVNTDNALHYDVLNLLLSIGDKHF